MRKSVVAVKPYIWENNSNFKLAPYEAWVKCGGKMSSSYYPPRILHGIAFHLEFPLWFKSKKEARLRFVEGASIRLDTFPDSFFYEVIPVIWDCWPIYWDDTEKWFRKYDIRTAIFTSSQTADEFRCRFPHMNILSITEGIEANLYRGEKLLKERSVDFLQYGRVTKYLKKLHLEEKLRVLSSSGENSLIHTREQLIEYLSDAKIVLSIPRCDMQPEIANGIETLTQRYWECMLSGVVIIGRAPKELIDLIGYNPVIDIDLQNIEEQLVGIVENIDKYQELVNKNRVTALKFADWNIRIKQIFNWLNQCNYNV